jgi:hypothetical protein
MDREGCLPVGKPLPVGGGVAVDEGDDERVAVGIPFELDVAWIVAVGIPFELDVAWIVAVGIPFELDVAWIVNIWVAELIGIRVLLSMVDVVVFVKGVGAQPHPVITIIVVPELAVYGELEQ